MKYPNNLKDEHYDVCLARLAHSAYAECDQPYLYTQRISLSPDFEEADVKAKRLVDVVGTADNLWSLSHWKET